MYLYLEQICAFVAVFLKTNCFSVLLQALRDIELNKALDSSFK